MHRIGAFIGSFGDDIVGAVHHVGVAVSSAEESVIPGTSVEGIISGISVDLLFAAAADEVVCAGSAPHGTLNRKPVGAGLRTRLISHHHCISPRTVQERQQVNF